MLSKVAYVCDGKVVKTVFRVLSRLLSIGEYADLGQAGKATLSSTAASGKKPKCRSPSNEDKT